MRRANGDWFALEGDSRRLVPLFHSSHDAFMARLRTVDMLVFSPVALDARLLKNIIDDQSEVDFCIVDNPFANLSAGQTLPHAQVISLITNGNAPQPFANATVGSNSDGAQ
jgi:hypothetical protein